jgi:hypothetical protein
MLWRGNGHSKSHIIRLGIVTKKENLARVTRFVRIITFLFSFSLSLFFIPSSLLSILLLFLCIYTCITYSLFLIYSLPKHKANILLFLPLIQPLPCTKLRNSALFVVFHIYLIENKTLD